MWAKLLGRYLNSGWQPLLVYVLVYGAGWLFRIPLSQPCGLLTVFRALHCFHLVVFFGYGVGPILRHGRAATGSALFLCTLFALLWIPGPFLEFPGDPWEHIRRITAWKYFPEVAACSYRQKFSYFLSFSLLEGIPDGLRAAGLRLLHVGFSLFLLREYYWLGRAVGIRAGILKLALLGIVLSFGNSAFTFFRYYSLSSTIFGQIGAIIAIRELVLLARREFRTAAIRRALPPLMAAAVIIAANHVQGALVAALGAGAIACWHISRRWGLWRAIALLFVVSGIGALILAPRLPAALTGTRWLTSYGAFNVFNSGSPPLVYCVQILGLAGVINLCFGLLLLARNHLIGWLTVFPAIFLCSPALGGLFALTLWDERGEIALFYRVLFAIPPVFASIVWLAEWVGNRTAIRSILPIAAVVTAIALLVLVPARAPFFGRLWPALGVPPDDLTLTWVWSPHIDPQLTELVRRDQPVVTPPGLGFALAATGKFRTVFDERLITFPRLLTPAAAVERNLAMMVQSQWSLQYFEPPTRRLATPYSQAARLSGQWLPQELDLQFSRPYR